VTAPLAARSPALVGRPPHERSVLPSGLRVITQAMPAARSVSTALFVPVGSRHEDEAHAGLSHMLEHLVFKGTRAHPEPGSLSELIEGCGGTVNASTDRELTVYSARVPADQAPIALEVLAELALRPLLRKRDLQAEKPVILDEIQMYVDSPADYVFTVFDELLFGSHPLGREIAGTPRSVRRASEAAAVGHWARWYRPSGMVLSAAGAIDHARVAATASGWQQAGPEAASGTPAPAALPAVGAAPTPVAPGALRVVNRKLGQGNLCLGMPGVSRADPDRWALDLLGAILGDGMSSRLFLELRERRSLVYDVSTFSAMYADCGTIGVHAGFAPDDAVTVIGAILEQLDRICSDPVPPAELERARAYTRGRIELRMEESHAVAGWLGIGESLLPRVLTVEEVIERLDAVTADVLLRVAQRILRPGLARMAVLGPFRSRRRLESAMSPA